MTTVTIPKKLAAEGDLILIPRKEYESLLRTKKIEVFKPTMAEKKPFERREKNSRGASL